MSRESVFQCLYSITVDGMLQFPSVDITASSADIAVAVVIEGISGPRGVYNVITESVATFRVSDCVEVVVEGEVSRTDTQELTLTIQEYVRSLDISQ